MKIITSYSSADFTQLIEANKNTLHALKCLGATSVVPLLWFNLQLHPQLTAQQLLRNDISTAS